MGRARPSDRIDSVVRPDLNTGSLFARAPALVVIGYYVVSGFTGDVALFC